MEKKNILYTIVRIVFGLMMIGSGIGMLATGGFPIEYENAVANEFMAAMENTGYFVYLLGIVKVICGISFVSNRFVPLALVIFMPVSINMVLFHLFLEFASGVPAYAILIMNKYLMFKNIKAYQPLLKMK